jgi:serine/threonine protein kinase
MLDNKYMIIKNLGGTVTTRAHLVKDVTCNETLAIKIAEKGEKAELEQEYDFLSSFDHPNIIKPHIFVSEGQIVYEDDRKEMAPKTDEEAVNGDKPCAYFTLKFYENGDLFENISRGGPVHEGIARYYFQQLVSAVEYIHSKNVAHRDIKLDNILVDDSFQLILIDFGFAEEFRTKTSEKLDDTVLARALGTKGYISPEQFINDGSEPI